MFIRNRKHTSSKPDISYPNSLINGNAVQSSFNSHSRRHVTEFSDSDSDESEDEIQKIKSKYKTADYQELSEKDSSGQETAVFVPKVNQSSLLMHDNGNDVDLLRQFAASYNAARPNRKPSYQPQESIVI